MNEVAANSTALRRPKARRMRFLPLIYPSAALSLQPAAKSTGPARGRRGKYALFANNRYSSGSVVK
jgi:hypothetical protein